MARYRKYTKTIVKAPKKKWNFGNVYWDTVKAFPMNGVSACYGTPLIENSTDTTSPAPPVVKVKHLKVEGQLTVSSAAIEQTTASPKLFQLFVVYIPQVVVRNWTAISTPNDRFNWAYQMTLDHPEWVMARKTVNMEWDGGTPGEKKIKTFSFTSGKMSRNLKSGDRIMLFYMSQYLTDNHMYTVETVYANIRFANVYN